MLNDRRVSFALLQETFWDKAYIDGIKHMFEGKIYVYFLIILKYFDFSK
jgi:hypothetical protein